ncbi:MAG: iron-containing alcohol dehydrogenase [Clostridiales bacterium]|nr:iron-containing alcohol dehydrogenase [Clostridiales bacterium]
MNEFSFSTKLFFGEGSLGRLRSIKGKRVLVITDSFIYNCGTAQKVEKYLANCKVTYFKDVVPDPPVEVISAGIKSLIKAEAEVLIAIGGGSALDSAKAIKSMAEQIYPEKIRICEFVAIPTTSGTGSEVTDLAIITDKESNIKFPLQGAELRPCTAILDPTLVLSAPPSVTADTGMDVLTHAIEAYVSNGATDFSDALAEKAAALVMEFLPLVYKNGGNILAREKMHNASCMAGLAFNSAGLGLTHGISHALGAHLHIPHGRARRVFRYCLRTIRRFYSKDDKQLCGYSHRSSCNDNFYNDVRHLSDKNGYTALNSLHIAMVLLVKQGLQQKLLQPLF